MYKAKFNNCCFFMITKSRTFVARITESGYFNFLPRLIWSCGMYGLTEIELLERWQKGD